MAKPETDPSYVVEKGFNASVLSSPRVSHSPYLLWAPKQPLDPHIIPTDEDTDPVIMAHVSIFSLMRLDKSFYGRVNVFSHSFFKDLRA